MDKTSKIMRVVIHYVSKQGAILITENTEYSYEHASEQGLQSFAKKHLETLDLSQRCASAIVAAQVYTLSTTAVWT